MKRIMTSSSLFFTERITIPISEYDIELCEQLVSGGDSFSWNFDGVDVTFVKQEEEE